MKIVFLGTNGWYDSPRGNTVCILIETDEASILLDAGNGLYKADRHIVPEKPVHLFISHTHLDHIIVSWFTRFSIKATTHKKAMNPRSPRKLITFDWAMKRLLRSKANFEILEGFLSELLGEDITILEILESESKKESKSDKFNRVDLKVKNDKDELIIIEVQYDREYDYLQRILYGTSRLITEHQEEGDTCATMVKVISVNILYFDLGNGSDYIYHGATSFTGIHDHDTLELERRQQILYGARWLTTLKNCTQVVELGDRGIKRIGTYSDIVGAPLVAV